MNECASVGVGFLFIFSRSLLQRAPVISWTVTVMIPETKRESENRHPNLKSLEMTSRRRSARTGRTTYICSDDDFVRLGLGELLPQRKYAVENNVKVTELFGRGTDVLPKELRTFLLAFFQKAFQTRLDMRLFFHPEHSPIDDANLIDVVDAIENSPRTPERLDMDAGRDFAQDLLFRYSFCAHAYARTIAKESLEVVDIVQSFRAEGVELTPEQAVLPMDDLWRLQGGFVCLFCTDRVLNWKRCTSCNARTCTGCVIFRDLAFGTNACGHCGATL